MLEHRFTGPPFTIGIEEELMILDPGELRLAQEIEPILRAVPPELAGQVKPELMQSVLEIATTPCANVAAAGEQLGLLRRTVAEIAGERGLLLAAAGTHPFAHWEDQEIVDRPRYRELAEELGFIARRELIFGTHVHVAIEDPDRAIYVADGLRRYMPLLLALSANSPFWRGMRTGMMSSRTADLPRLSAGRDPAPLRNLGGLLEPGRADDARRLDRRLHLFVVGRAAAS